MLKGSKKSHFFRMSVPTHEYESVHNQLEHAIVKFFRWFTRNITYKTSTRPNWNQAMDDAIFKIQFDVEKEVIYTERYRFRKAYLLITIFVFLPWDIGLIHNDGNTVIHGERCIQFHLLCFQFLGMKHNRSKTILQIPERNLNIPSFPVYLYNLSTR